MRIRKTVVDFRKPEKLEGFDEILPQIQEDKIYNTFPETLRPYIHRFSSTVYYEASIKNSFIKQYNQTTINKILNKNIDLSDWNKAPTKFRNDLIEKFDYGQVPTPVVLYCRKSNEYWCLSGMYTIIYAMYVRKLNNIQITEIQV